MMATTSVDNSVRIWDVENQKFSLVYSKCPAMPTRLNWDLCGKVMALSMKGGKFSLFDIRCNDKTIADIAQTHNGPKSQKNVWLNDHTILTSGFNRKAEREYATWDLRNLSKETARSKFGNGSGVGHIYCDQALGLVWCAGRGDMGVGMWQYSTKAANNMLHLGDSMSPFPTKCFSMMPKWTIDVNKHEVQRGCRITNDKFLTYVAFTLANRTGLFQPEL